MFNAFGGFKSAAQLLIKTFCCNHKLGVAVKYVSTHA